jgi:hypothetical protein
VPACPTCRRGSIRSKRYGPLPCARYGIARHQQTARFEYVNPRCTKKTNSVDSRSIARKLRQCLIIVFVTAKLATPAWAQVICPFHVPAGDLTSSLDELARQADVEILFVSSLTEHRSAPTVEGTLSVADGLARLLAGTGLLFRQVDSGTVAVMQDSASRVALGAKP